MKSFQKCKVFSGCSAALHGGEKTESIATAPSVHTWSVYNLCCPFQPHPITLGVSLRNFPSIDFWHRTDCFDISLSLKNAVTNSNNHIPMFPEAGNMPAALLRPEDKRWIFTISSSPLDPRSPESTRWRILLTLLLKHLFSASHAQDHFNPLGNCPKFMRSCLKSVPILRRSLARLAGSACRLCKQCFVHFEDHQPLWRSNTLNPQAKSAQNPGKLRAGQNLGTSRRLESRVVHLRMHELAAQAHTCSHSSAGQAFVFLIVASVYCGRDTQGSMVGLCFTAGNNIRLRSYTDIGVYDLAEFGSKTL
jgi:hypothetical protein